jgi:hypothetical protein
VDYHLTSKYHRGYLGWICFCQSYYVLLFREIKSLPRLYLLLGFYGRYGHHSQDGRSQNAAKAVQRRSRRGVRRAPLRASLGGGAPTSGVGRYHCHSYSHLFVSCVFVKVFGWPPLSRGSMHLIACHTNIQVGVSQVLNVSGCTCSERWWAR